MRHRRKKRVGKNITKKKKLKQKKWQWGRNLRFILFLLFSCFCCFVPAAVGCINCAKFPTRSISRRLEQDEQQQLLLLLLLWGKPAQILPLDVVVFVVITASLQLFLLCNFDLLCSQRFLRAFALLSTSSSSFSSNIYVRTYAGDFLFSPFGFGSSECAANEARVDEASQVRGAQSSLPGGQRDGYFV